MFTRMHILHNCRATIDFIDRKHLAVRTALEGVVGSRGFDVGSFILDEWFGDDAVHGFGTGEGDEGFGDFAHETDCAAAVDEGDVVGVEDLS